jgi:hypothetical protein
MTAQMIASAMLLGIFGLRSKTSRGSTTARRTDPKRFMRAASLLSMTLSAAQILMTMAERSLARGEAPIEARLYAPWYQSSSKLFAT